MNRYDSYKKVDLPWLKEVPSHWEVKRVKRVFYISKDISYKENPIVLSLARDKIKIRDIESNIGQLAENYSNYNTVKIGDLLLNPMDLYSGANCNISYYDGVISPAYTNLRTEQDINLRYFDFLFKIQYTSLAFQSVGKGVSKDNRWTLSNETLLNYKIIVPNKKEQTQIANYLDWKINEIDKMIAKEKEKVQRIIEFYKKYLNSKISECNGDVYKLKNIFTFGKGLSITKEHLSDVGIRCINYGEIHNLNYFSFSSKDSNLKGLNNNLDIRVNEISKLKKGDFVFCDTSEDIEGCGNFSYKSDEELSYAGYHTIVAKPKKSFNSLFLAFYFDSDVWKDTIRKNVKGIKVYSITQSILKSSSIVLPSKEIQDKLSLELEEKKQEINKFKKMILKKIQNLESLKQSLISEVVTGQIDVRDVEIPEYEKFTIETEEKLEEEVEEDV